MPTYPKIQSIYKRDPDNQYKTFTTEYATPEIGYLADCEWEFTEKVDGTNIRIGWDGAQAEGLVLRSTVQMFDRRQSRIVTKVKRKDFI